MLPGLKTFTHVAIDAPAWPPPGRSTGVDEEKAGKEIPCVYETNGYRVPKLCAKPAFAYPGQRLLEPLVSFFFREHTARIAA